MDTDKLGIPMQRRVGWLCFGAVMVLCAFSYLLQPVWMPPQVLGMQSSSIGIFIAVGFVWCIPTLFYPCLFNRFPRWVARSPGLTRRAMATMGVPASH